MWKEAYGWYATIMNYTRFLRIWNNKLTRFGWAGNLMRVTKDGIPRKVSTMQMDGWRQRGRPKLRQIDNVSDDSKVFGLWNWRNVWLRRRLLVKFKIQQWVAGDDEIYFRDNVYLYWNEAVCTVLSTEYVVRYLNITTTNKHACSKEKLKSFPKFCCSKNAGYVYCETELRMKCACVSLRTLCIRVHRHLL